MLENRRQARATNYRPQGLRIGYSAWAGPERVIPAQLVDFSEGGLGLLMLAPLVLDSIVSVAGELHSADSCLGLQGHARVVYCCFREDGVYRTGLRFEDIHFRHPLCRHNSEPLEDPSGAIPGQMSPADDFLPAW